MKRSKSKTIDQKLDVVVDLLRHLLVLELHKEGVIQDNICRQLHITKQTVVDMLKGVKHE